MNFCSHFPCDAVAEGIVTVTIGAEVQDKQLVADLSLDKHILQDVLSKKL